MASPGIKRQVLTTVGSGAVWAQNFYVSPFNVGFGLEVSAANATVKHTFDDIFSMTTPAVSAVWYPHEFVVSASSNADGNYAYPVAAIRVSVASVVTASNGRVVFTLIPAGIAGN